MNLASYTKTDYKIAQTDVMVTIESGTPIIRTGNHFHKYYTTKVVQIPQGTEFSIYNATRSEVVVDVPDFDALPLAAVEFSNKQYIGTGKIRSGEKRLKVFEKFYEYYTSLDYEVFTTDSDHEVFNRSVFRNVCAAVFPQEVMILLDGDAFYTKQQLDNAVEQAKVQDKIIRPTKFFAFVDVEGDFDPCHLLDHLNKKSLEIPEEMLGERLVEDRYHYYMGRHLCSGGWVLRPHHWVGMDERIDGWGGEDMTFDRSISALNLSVEIHDGCMASVDHDGRDTVNGTKNITMFELDYKKPHDVVSTRRAALIEDLLIMHAGYKTYGRFAKWE